MSKQTKQGHTPGPWSIEDKGSVTQKEKLVITGGDAGRVCTMSRHDVKWRQVNQEQTDRTPAEVKANAALIAAAPELLEALKEIVRYMKNETDSPSTVYDKVKAAIAKAEGCQ